MSKTKTGLIDTSALDTIASQELTVLLDKMKLELDTLIALYRFDTKAISYLNKSQDAWEKYVTIELKLLEYELVEDSMCQLKVNAMYQELIILRIQELSKKIGNKREARNIENENEKIVEEDSL